jgi:hypothetical protein
MRTRWSCATLLLVAPVFASKIFVQDAAAIMAQVAANVEGAVEARRQFVYQQNVRGTMSQGGQRIRRENRQYTVVPSSTGTDKKLLSFNGEYRKGKQSVSYSAPLSQKGDAEDKGGGVDEALLEDLTEALVNAKGSRDGIPGDLFPLHSKDLPGYTFSFEGESQLQGRPVHKIAFQPVKKDLCGRRLASDEDDDCEHPSWAGTAWIDKAELQPVRIDTKLAQGIPWAVRTFLGFNLKQLGFAVTYTRAAEGVWFPATYGTEFQVELYFFYKRTISLNLESSGFQKTDAASTIQYDLAHVPVP